MSYVHGDAVTIDPLGSSTGAVKRAHACHIGTLRPGMQTRLLLIASAALAVIILLAGGVWLLRLLT